jgi:hypothetical protein
MRRRDFIKGIAGPAVVWPLVARAQQPTVPVVGVLDPRLPGNVQDLLRVFRQGLKDTGYVEGENLALEYRWAENQMDRLPTLAADLVRRRVAVIAAISPAAAVAAKAATTTLPIGREGFTWSGTEHISQMKEWPDWLPPPEMIKRQPYLPRFMAGGETNPLGARAMYLGNTVYRIHGTNQPSTIGSFVSSGCIRLTNEDVEDLYSRVTIGTTVVVLPGANAAASQLRPRH